jgi:5-methylcytosine-specific restriction endonuclease McrA
MIGKVFGNWTVIEELGRGKTGHLLYKCRCSCGNTRNIIKSHLKESSKFCVKCRYPDITGEVFGDLTAVRNTKTKKSGGFVWEWLCVCGILHYANIAQVRIGSIRSCGHSKRPDITGQIFTNIKVLSLGKTKDGQRYWNCLCACGNLKEIRTGDLLSGGVKSCGCLYIETQRNIGKFGKDNHNYKHGLSKTQAYKNAHGRDRRDRIRQNGYEEVDPLKLKEKFNKFNNSCAYCGKKEKLEIDHLVPVSRGGVHALRNLVPACAHCNRTKNSKILFLEWQPKIVHPELESTLNWFKRH